MKPLTIQNLTGIMKLLFLGQVARGRGGRDVIEGAWPNNRLVTVLEAAGARVRAAGGVGQGGRGWEWGMV